MLSWIEIVFHLATAAAIVLSGLLLVTHPTGTNEIDAQSVFGTTKFTKLAKTMFGVCGLGSNNQDLEAQGTMGSP